MTKCLYSEIYEQNVYKQNVYIQKVLEYLNKLHVK